MSFSPQISILPTPLKSCAKAANANGIAAPAWARSLLWFTTFAAIGAGLTARAGAGFDEPAIWIVAALGSSAATSLFAVDLRQRAMKWLPIVLILCGFSTSQSWLLSSIIQSVLDTGIIRAGHGAAPAPDTRA